MGATGRPAGNVIDPTELDQGVREPPVDPQQLGCPALPLSPMRDGVDQPGSERRHIGDMMAMVELDRGAFLTPVFPRRLGRPTLPWSPSRSVTALRPAPVNQSLECDGVSEHGVNGQGGEGHGMKEPGMKETGVKGHGMKGPGGKEQGTDGQGVKGHGVIKWDFDLKQLCEATLAAVVVTDGCETDVEEWNGNRGWDYSDDSMGAVFDGGGAGCHGDGHVDVQFLNAKQKGEVAAVNNGDMGGGSSLDLGGEMVKGWNPMGEAGVGPSESVIAGWWREIWFGRYLGMLGEPVSQEMRQWREIWDDRCKELLGKPIGWEAWQWCEGASY